MISAQGPTDARTLGRLRPVLGIAFFDVGGPLLSYALLRREGLSTVTALVLSGVLPTVRVG